MFVLCILKFCLLFFFGLALEAVGCASRAGRVAIGLKRECPRPITTHTRGLPMFRTALRRTCNSERSSNSRPPRRFNAFRRFGPLARGPAKRETLQFKAAPLFFSLPRLRPAGRRTCTSEDSSNARPPAFFESPAGSARSPAERNIGRLLPCNAPPPMLSVFRLLGPLSCGPAGQQNLERRGRPTF